jgi:hypothetical protein
MTERNDAISIWEVWSNWDLTGQELQRVVRTNRGTIMSQALANDLPALILLVATVIISLAVLYKLDNVQITEIVKEHSFVPAAVVLFIVLCALELFKPVSWTADVLKVIVGVVVGAGAAGAVSQTAMGTHIQQAGRDLIGRMEGPVSRMEGTIGRMEGTINRMQGMVSTMEGQIQQVNGDVESIRNSAVQISSDRSEGPSILVRETVYAQSSDPQFSSTYKTLHDQLPNSRKWIIDLLADQSIDETIRGRIEQLEKEGWRISEIGEFDNHQNGLAFTLHLKRPFGQVAA